tara:strand:+ start:1156 stop:1413 length:258 start_codon:yes stop_codon:yes gene_type:complete
MTEEQRIAVIAKAVENSQSVAPSQSVEDFIAEIKTEQVLVEHGLLDTQREDLEDESQFLFTDVAEEIDEEDQSMGLSDEMRGVYS